MNTVKNLAISTAVFSSLLAKHNSSPLRPEEFWQHCLGVAVGCKLMARNLKISSQSSETFFIAGLLHDVGKILFIRTDPGRYKKALEESSRFGVSLCFTEQVYFGCSHTQAGGVLAKKWRLEGPVARAIEYHHKLQSKNDSLMDVLVIVNNMCKKTGTGQSGNGIVEEIAENSARRMKVNQRDWNRVAGQLPVEVDKAAEFLKFFKE
jgi:putative nucleotidyltransferase with HDIG domain